MNPSGAVRGQDAKSDPHSDVLNLLTTYYMPCSVLSTLQVSFPLCLTEPGIVVVLIY